MVPKPIKYHKEWLLKEKFCSEVLNERRRSIDRSIKLGAKRGMREPLQKLYDQKLKFSDQHTAILTQPSIAKPQVSVNYKKHHPVIEPSSGMSIETTG